MEVNQVASTNVGSSHVNVSDHRGLILSHILDLHLPDYYRASLCLYISNIHLDLSHTLPSPINKDERF